MTLFLLVSTHLSNEVEGFYCEAWYRTWLNSSYFQLFIFYFNLHICISYVSHVSDLFCQICTPPNCTLTKQRRWDGNKVEINYWSICPDRKMFFLLPATHCTSSSFSERRLGKDQVSVTSLSRVWSSFESSMQGNTRPCSFILIRVWQFWETEVSVHHDTWLQPIVPLFKQGPCVYAMTY